MKKTIHPWCFRPALLKAVLLAMLVCVGVRGGAQNFQWAISSGGEIQEYGDALAIDNNSNTYFTVFSYSPVCYVNNIPYEILGQSDFFLIKYDKFGNFMWVKQLGGPNYFNPPYQMPKAEGIKNIVFDSLSNTIYISGLFYESINFGDVSLSTSTHDLQIFLAKFDLYGNCLWARKAGGYGDEDWDVNISVDEFGNIYMCGNLPETGNFSGISVQQGGFLAKYSPEGDCIWAKRISENPNPLIAAYDMLAIKSFNGKIYIVGQTYYGVISVDSSMIAGNGTRYVLTIFDELPNLLSFKQFAGPGIKNIASAIAVDHNHNLCFTGSFEGNYATFGEDTIYSSGVREMFVFKCDELGNNIWVRQANATEKVNGNYVHCDNNGNVYVTGDFFGSATFGEHQIEAASNLDMFIAKFTSDGECCGTTQAHVAMGMGLATDYEGFIYATGMYWTEGVFGPHILPCLGYSDVYVTRHEPIIVGTHDLVTTPDNRLLIYSNPSTGNCNISIPEELQHEENLTMLVYDNAGKLILQKSINMQEEKISLNLQTEAKGIYNAILTNGKQKFQGKVVVE